MRKKLIIGLAALLACLGIAVMLVAYAGRGAQGAFTATFLHYTNNASGTNLAVVRLSNGTRATIIYWGQCNVFFRTKSNSPFSMQHPPLTLRPSQSQILTLSVGNPKTGQAWRAHFVCSPQGWRITLDRFVERLAGFGLPVGRPGVPGLAAETAWVEM